MSFAEDALSDAHARVLLDVARRSIRYGLRERCPLPTDPAVYALELRVPRATFVTLHRLDILRGCTGCIEPSRPLVVDVAANAYRSAFADPRFDPLTETELEGLDAHISILSRLARVDADSEEALLRQLRPKTDGLVLRDGPCQGVFLPSVWDSLPDPRRFVRELKLKAGLPGDHWSDTIECDFFTVQSIA